MSTRPPRDGEISERFVRASILLALAILSFHAALLAYGLIGMAFGVRPGWAVLLLAGATTVGAIITGASDGRSARGDRATVGIVLALTVVAVVGSSLLAGTLFDGSYDGQAYHQSAVTALARGWNPAAAVEDIGTSFDIWIVHYPKGPWIQAAAFYGAVDSIEHAKGSGLALSVAAFAAWLALLLTLAPRRPAAAATVALIATANPVMLAQAFTFMVDGQLASLFSTCLALGGLLFLRSGRGSVLAALSCGALLISLTKFTGLAYVMLLIAGLALVSVFRRPTLSRSLIAAVLAGVLVVAVGAVGYDTYVVNAVRHGSPFYPLSGDEPIDVVTAQMPGELVGKGRLEKLARAVLSRAANEKGPGTGTSIKIPLTMTRKELVAYWAPDTRVAGMGPLFGGALLIAFPLAVALVVPQRLRVDLRARFAALGLMIVAVTVLANGEAWWARLAPQLWLLPVIVVAAALLADATRPLRLAGWLLAGLLMVNVAIVGGMGLSRQVEMTRYKHELLADLSQAPGGVLLKLNTFDELTLKFAERGIPFRVVTDDAELDTEGIAFPNTPGIVYPAGDP